MAVRCFCRNAQVKDGRLSIHDTGEIHHLKNVLRLKVQDALIVFDGCGTEYAGIVDRLDVSCVEILVKNVKKSALSRPLLILACAIPKKSKFELIIEKAVELGADEILPLLTRRTEVILKGEAVFQKRERYEKVAVAAAKQSGRASIPVIYEPLKLSSAVELLKPRSHLIVPSLSGDRWPVLEALKMCDRQKPAAFLIGPEGDFTPEEYALMKSEGGRPVSLGPAVLKVETAALAVMAAAQLFWDAQGSSSDGYGPKT